ncbi:MAG: hypothetical protein V4662_12030 [Verrucomicrobiota bacterium]
MPASLIPAAVGDIRPVMTRDEAATQAECQPVPAPLITTDLQEDILKVYREFFDRMPQELVLRFEHGLYNWAPRKLQAAWDYEKRLRNPA